MLIINAVNDLVYILFSELRTKLSFLIFGLTRVPPTIFLLQANKSLSASRSSKETDIKDVVYGTTDTQQLENRASMCAM